MEHYAYWKAELPGFPLPMGAFGENFTTEGMRGDTVHLGDRFSVGSAEVVVTQPRMPCYKLGIRFGKDDMVKRFLRSGRSGIYLAVTREGDVGTGDELTVVSRDLEAVSIAEITRLYLTKRFTSDDVSILSRAARVEAFPESWKDYFRERVEREGV